MRYFAFENKKKYIAYTCFKKGLTVQCKRRYLPLKWFSKAPPPWFLVTDMFRSGSDLLFQDSTIAPMQIKAGVRKKNNKPCYWWFFRNAMYLSVPGRFIYNQDSIAATWRYLIRWIWIWCRSPSAVIVSIPVKWLSETSNEQLHIHARMLRSCLGMLFKSQEKRLPIYLVVTNLQQVEGAKRWLQLDDGIPLGMTGKVLEGSYFEKVNYQLTKAKDSFWHSLSVQRLNLLQKSRSLPDAATLLFPEKVVNLFEPLKNYLNPLCEKDKYMEYGVLSGIFMTGQHVDEQRAVRGIFSPYLLDEFIPRHQVKIQQQCVPGLWWFVRKSIYVSTFLAVIVLFSNAFSNVQRDLTDIKTENNTSNIESSHLRLENLFQLNSNKINNFLFGFALDFLQRKEAKVFLRMTRGQKLPVSRLSKDILERFNKSTTQQQANLIINLSRFINIEKEIYFGAPLSKVENMPQYSTGLLFGTSLSIPFSQQLLRRKAENILGDKEDFALWHSILMSMLKSKNDLSWVLVSDFPAAHPDISVASYWHASDDGNSVDNSSAVRNLVLHDDTDLEWIYTLAGEEFIRKTLDQIQNAEGNTSAFIESRKNFWKYYLHRRQSAWIYFANTVHAGKYMVRGKKNWRALLRSIIYSDSPYDRILADISNNLATISDSDAEPWLVLLRQLEKQKELLDSSSFFIEISRNQLLLRNKMFRRVRKDARMNGRNNRTLFSDTAISHRKDYEYGVKNLAQLTLDNPQDASHFFASNSDKAVMKTLPSSVSGLLTYFSRWKDDSSEQAIDEHESVVWDLFKGDTQLISDYMLLVVASQLQDSWNSKVVWPLDAQTQNSTVDIESVIKDTYKNIISLLKKNTLFLSVTPKDGFVPVKLNDDSLPFTQAFINYINTYVNIEDITGQSLETRKRLLDEKLALEQQAVVDDQSSDFSKNNEVKENKAVELVIQGKPSTANADALVLPVGTSVSLRCDEGMQTIKYMYIYTTKTLFWQPSLCSDILSTVHFPGFSVTKKYSGLTGILDYIKDFSYGEHTYEITDFGDNVELLKKNNVKYITVRYNLNGVSDIESAYSTWQNDYNYNEQKNNKKNEIQSQLMSIEQPTHHSGILTSLPNNIVRLWILSSTGNN